MVVVGHVDRGQYPDEQHHDGQSDEPGRREGDDDDAVGTEEARHRGRDGPGDAGEHVGLHGRQQVMPGGRAGRDTDATAAVGRGRFTREPAAKRTRRTAPRHQLCGIGGSPGPWRSALAHGEVPAPFVEPSDHGTAGQFDALLSSV
jgi:hypothetical protein